MTETERNRLLKAAHDALGEARRNYRDACKALFPEGTYIRWKEGPYIKSGVITGHTVFGAPMVGVRNVTFEAILALAEQET